MSCGSGGSKSSLAKAAVQGHQVSWEMKNYTPFWREAHFEVKGLENPTSQFLPKIGNRTWSRMGKEGKTKEVVEDRSMKELYVKSCVTKLCVKDGVWQSCVWKMMCVCVIMLHVKNAKSHAKGKTEDVVCRERRHRQRRWCRIEQLESCMWKLCVKEGVRWQMVCEGVCVCVCECDDFEQTCVCVNHLNRCETSLGFLFDFSL